MKNFLSIMVILFVGLVAGSIVAGPLDSVPLIVEDVRTNGTAITASVDTSTALDGKLYAIVFDISGYANPTCDVDIVTTEDRGAGIVRTLYSANSIGTTNFTVYPRVQITSLGGVAGTPATNVVTMIPLVGDVVELIAYNANTNAAFDVKALIIMEK